MSQLCQHHCLPTGLTAFSNTSQLSISCEFHCHASTPFYFFPSVSYLTCTLRAVAIMRSTYQGRIQVSWTPRSQATKRACAIFLAGLLCKARQIRWQSPGSSWDTEKDQITAPWQNLRTRSELNDLVTSVTIFKSNKNVWGQIYFLLPLNLDCTHCLKSWGACWIFYSISFYQAWESCVNVNMCWINPGIPVAPSNDVFPSCPITGDYYFFSLAILHLISPPYIGVNIPDYLNSFLSSWDAVSNVLLKSKCITSPTLHSSTNLVIQ